MRFKTPNFYSKWQLGAIPFLTAQVFLVIYFTTSYTVYQSVSAAIFMYIIAFAGLLLFFRIARGWFTTCYVIEIHDTMLIGWNLWGKRFELALGKITAVEKMPGFNQFHLIAQKGEPFIIYGNIDYYGFLMDYIVERMPHEVNIDKNFLSKLRQMTRFWKYTKQMPGTGWYFQTKYEPGYIEKLESVVAKQRDDLIRRGVLREDAFYGEPTWPKEFAKAKVEGRAWAL